MTIWREQYADLERAALSPAATQEDIDRLGEWFERFGEMYWTGEFYRVDNTHNLRPVLEEVEGGDFCRIGWEIL